MLTGCGYRVREEYAHAMNLYDFVQDRQGKVTLFPIEQPTVEFGSVLDVMEATLAHEQEVSRLINRLYELASQQSDYPTQVHLQAFITEQVEEEKTSLIAAAHDWRGFQQPASVGQ